jgi:hypothetical protein
VRIPRDITFFAAFNVGDRKKIRRDFLVSSLNMSLSCMCKIEYIANAIDKKYAELAERS